MFNTSDETAIAIEPIILPQGSLHSSHAIVVNTDKRQGVLLELSADEKIYPASLTKIMTAMIVLKSGAGLDEKITLGQDIYNEVLPQNLMTAGLMPGEILSVEDLLYGMMLESGADAALGLAIHVAGSEASFAELMNNKAAELGMDHSHFTNATGRHDPEQYTTMRDMSVLLGSALINDSFYEIFTSHSHTVDSTNKHPDGVTFHSSAFGYTNGDYGDAKLLGGKTGYTIEAGQCLAGLWEINENMYIIITVGAQVDNNSIENKHIDDAVSLINTLWPDIAIAEPERALNGEAPGRPGLPPL
jgi:D-alanyl-D-alanine carboxypeptidase (penicillin-binding protein 5/6)